MDLARDRERVSPIWRHLLGVILSAGFLASPVQAEEEVSFDAAEFEKRAFDFRGYLELRPEYARTN